MTSTLKTTDLVNAADVARTFNIAPITVRNWLSQAGVVPEASYQYARGSLKLYDPKVAHAAIQKRLDENNPKFPALEFEKAKDTTAVGCGSQLDQLEELVSKLSKQVEGLQEQNRGLFRQMVMMHETSTKAIAALLSELGCQVPN